MNYIVIVKFVKHVGQSLFVKKIKEQNILKFVYLEEIILESYFKSNIDNFVWDILIFSQNMALEFFKIPGATMV